VSTPAPRRSRLLRRSRSGRPATRQPDLWIGTDDGARLAVWEHPPAQPPEPSGVDRLRHRTPPPVTVVLVHGWTLAAAVWDRVQAALVARHPEVRVVRYDQRGHGASSQRGSDASIGRLADDLALVVAAVAPEGPLVLVGHSMGGMAVLSAAGRHPELLGERTRGVLLVSTSAGGLGGAGRPLVPLMAALARLPETVLVPRAPRVITQRTNYGPGVDRDLVMETSRALGRVSGRSTGEWFAALMAHDETAALPAVAASAVPVTVLAGDGDRLTPPQHARAIAAAIPQAHLQVVPGTGHMLLVERPDVLVDCLDELLARPRAPRGRHWPGARRG
jgi:pimeloyl-ACP methyl ester carboxylesterase